MQRHMGPAEPASVTVNGRRTRNFICLVDVHKPPRFVRRTAGRYRVGAKNPKQAVRLLRDAIGFGTIQVYYEDNTDEISDVVPQGTCRKETWNPETRRFEQSDPVHMAEPRKQK